jgi:hypothetical protein
MEAVCHKYETLYVATMEYMSQLRNVVCQVMELVCHNYGTWCVKLWNWYVTTTERGVSSYGTGMSLLLKTVCHNHGMWYVNLGHKKV